METVIVEAYGLKYVVDRATKFIVEESYEPYMKDVVKLKHGYVFVDVGAHVGKYSFYASKQVGDSGLVIAIEPHPKNVENLRRGIKLNCLTNVKVVEKACSNYSGKGFLIEHEISAKCELVKKPTKIEVDVDTLDNVLKSLHVEKVDMIKIDVEGREYKVLQGAYKSLKRFKPPMMVEVILNNKQRVFKYLEEIEYKPRAIYKQKRYWDVLFKEKQTSAPNQKKT